MFDDGVPAAPRGAAAPRHDRRARRRPARTRASRRPSASSCSSGITFNVYGDSAGTERPFPVRPRAAHRPRGGVGLDRARPEAAHPRAQPVHQRHLPRAEDPQGRGHPRGGRPLGGVLPPAVRRHQPAARACGATSPAPIWSAHSDGQIYVLEDNLRVPSGVSYVLENRDLMKRTFPQVFEGLRVRPVDRVPEPAARDARSDRARAACTTKPVVVLLTPGMYNSAYFEHSYLAQKMGIPLVEGARPGRRGRRRCGCAPPRACAAST